MKYLINKICNYSLSQFFQILMNKIHPPKFIPDFKFDNEELKRLQMMPRNLNGETVLMGKKIKFTDAFSYLAMCDEIFSEQNYKFISKKESPFIIDCGSNIGISIIFFKLLYPKSRILAFEPDPDVFSCLKNNVEVFNFDGVEIRNEAVWINSGKSNFFSDGNWGGKISESASGENIFSVQTVRLKDYLIDSVDFLKIDIEGAEVDVIKDCSENISNVDNLFIEYHSDVNKVQALQEILQVISNSNMRYYIKEASDFKFPFLRNVLSGFDLQLNIYALRK